MIAVKNMIETIKIIIEIRSSLKDKSISKESIRDWIKSSKEDIESCKVLYQNRLYSGSTYHLQQATEKVIKAYLLAFRISDEKSLRKIGHATPNAYIDLIKQSWAQRLAEILSNTAKREVKSDTIQVENLLKKDTLKLAKMSGDEIRLNLELMNRIENNPKVTQYKRILNRIFKKGNFLDVVLNFSFLYILSFITFVHQKTTRYPDGEMKPSDYKEGLGIVDTTEEIIERLNKCVNSLEKTTQLTSSS